MKIFALSILLILFFSLHTGPIQNTLPCTPKQTETIPLEALQLIKVYPQNILAYKNGYLFFSDSSKILFDDGIKNKSAEELLKNPDVEDMFHYRYKTGNLFIPAFNEDPGRIRNELFFKKIYGSSAADVKKKCVFINWLSKTKKQKILFSTVGNAHLQLQKISDELEILPDTLKKFLFPLGGTFNFRKIAGTERASAHSYGIAIDLNTNFANYWRWQQKPNQKLNYMNKFPQQIINIFEKHGFIWGGRWYHYDTMHFEYRPELF